MIGATSGWNPRTVTVPVTDDRTALLETFNTLLGDDNAGEVVGQSRRLKGEWERIALEQPRIDIISLAGTVTGTRWHGDAPDSWQNPIFSTDKIQVAEWVGRTFFSVTGTPFTDITGWQNAPRFTERLIWQHEVELDAVIGDGTAERDMDAVPHAPSWWSAEAQRRWEEWRSTGGERDSYVDHLYRSLELPEAFFKFDAQLELNLDLTAFTNRDRRDDPTTTVAAEPQTLVVPSIAMGIETGGSGIVDRAVYTQTLGDRSAVLEIR